MSTPACNLTPSDVVVVYVTCPDAIVAESLARYLVASHLVACANIIPGMRSIYHWEGALTTSDEVILLLKTVARRAVAVSEAVIARHPYTTACVLTMSVAAAAPAFAAWVHEQTRDVPA